MLAFANIFEENPWYMDSGATNHLTTDASNMDAYTSYSGNEVVTTAKGGGMSTLFKYLVLYLFHLITFNYKIFYMSQMHLTISIQFTILLKTILVI